MSKKQTRCALSVSRSCYEALQAASVRHARSKASIVEEALREWLAAPDEQPAPQYVALTADLVRPDAMHGAADGFGGSDFDTYTTSTGKPLTREAFETARAVIGERFPPSPASPNFALPRRLVDGPRKAAVAERAARERDAGKHAPREGRDGAPTVSGRKPSRVDVPRRADNTWRK